jgi:hypothetical protein
MTSNISEEDLMVAIKNDEVDSFIELTEKFPTWKEHYLKEEDLYFHQYAASNFIFTKFARRNQYCEKCSNLNWTLI